MHGTYLQNKASYYRYIAKNRDKINALQRKFQQKKRTWKLISLEFLQILLD